MYYPEEVLREVREKTDIVTVISRYMTLQKRGRNYFGLCPFHGEKTPSFSVNASEQFYHCFGCGVGGNVFSFLQNIENLTFQEALTQLAQEANVVLPEAEISPQEKARIARRERMYEANREAGRFFYAQLVSNPQAAAAREYLEKRGVSQEFLKKFGLGYSPITRAGLTRYLMQKGYSFDMLKSLYLSNGTPDQPYDRFFNRVMFPIFDVRGRVIAFGGRVIGKGDPKYLNSSDTELFNKRKNLYAMNIARKSRRPQALLVEGYMDVFSLHQAGFDNAVASLGTALTDEQAMLIKRYFDEVCLIYDSDAAGTNAARRAIPILEKAGLKVRVLRVPGSKDPDEFIKANGAEAFEELLKTAMDPVAFELAISDTSTVDGQVAALKTMKERLMSIEDDAERELHIRDVASRLKINPETLARQVEEARRSQGTAEYARAREIRITPDMKGENGIELARKQLLAIMARYPASRLTILRYINAEDFREIAQPQGMPGEEGMKRSAQEAGPPQETAASTEDIYSIVMKYMESHLTQTIRIADLISLGTETEDQKRLSSVGSQMLPEDPEELEQMCTDIIKSLKTRVLDSRLRRISDAAELMTLIQKKKELEGLEIHFGS